VPQAQSPNSKDAQKDWDKNQERLLGAFVGCNVIAVILIFLLVPETAGASVNKEHGKLNYMSLEELNYIFGVPTAKHIRYQFQHVLPWAGSMVRYRVLRLMKRKADRPYIEKMYYWVAVKDAESSGSDEAEKSNEGGQEHREDVGEPGGESSAVDSRSIRSR